MLKFLNKAVMKITTPIFYEICEFNFRPITSDKSQPSLSGIALYLAQSREALSHHLLISSKCEVLQARVTARMRYAAASKRTSKGRLCVDHQRGNKGQTTVSANVYLVVRPYFSGATMSMEDIVAGWSRGADGFVF